MKPTLTILIEGYAHTTPDGVTYASPTTSLLQLDGKNYLVDPGCNGSLLLERLAQQHLQPSDIHALFVSHYHPDHFLNIRLFPTTPFYDGSMRWEQDSETMYSDYWLRPEFKVFATPGHATEQFSILVDTDNFGLVSISQDVFWWEDGKQKSDTIEELMSLVDPFANDVVALKESRELVLGSGAKWIVPGHGKMFRNPKFYFES
jgi:glyoxylase-like metal-dependent hydrolase (beta-lactamase superfamily II)